MLFALSRFANTSPSCRIDPYSACAAIAVAFSSLVRNDGVGWLWAGCQHSAGIAKIGTAHPPILCSSRLPPAWRRKVQSRPPTRANWRERRRQPSPVPLPVPGPGYTIEEHYLRRDRAALAVNAGVAVMLFRFRSGDSRRGSVTFQSAERAATRYPALSGPATNGGSRYKRRNANIFGH